mmetsp:Transcript_144571/g.402874  ORF Transcript_144571/g.402874 Transcript_144571/m.402874 type:complete len:638 (+) Transcript_144571:19-1932(+)
MLPSIVRRSSQKNASILGQFTRAPTCIGRTGDQWAIATTRLRYGTFGVANAQDVLAAVFWQQVTDRTDRVVPSVCGLSVGIGLVCLTVSCLDWWERQHIHEGCQPRASRPERVGAEGVDGVVRAASQPLLGILANRLVRKNSRLAIHEAYTFLSGPPLGAGSFGVVLRAVHNRTGIVRAVKRIDKRLVHDNRMLSREVESLRLMDHPHVCRLVEYYETRHHLWLVTELCRGEELCNRLLAMPTGLPEPQVAHLMLQMFRATLHCHHHSVVHRDLKPENFLVASGRGCDMLKLIDFGFSVQVASSLGSPVQDGKLPSVTRSRSPSQGEANGNRVLQHGPPEAGTLLYMSPQMLCGERASWSDDVWSLGVIFYILLTGQFPFSTNDDHRFQDLCANGLLERDVQEHLKALPNSPAARDLAAKLLTFDAGKRITIEAALQHHFLSDVRCSVAAEWLSAEEVYERCVRFSKTCRLRCLVTAVIVRLMGDSWADSERVRATFFALDKTGNGSVAPSDLQDFLLSKRLRVRAPWFAGLPCSSPMVPEHTAPLSYTAFAAATLDDPAISGDERLCRTVFELLDADHDGRLSVPDLQRRLELSRQECEDAIVEALHEIGVTAYEKAGMDLPEFLQMMQAPVRLHT